MTDIGMSFEGFLIRYVLIGLIVVSALFLFHNIRR